MSKLRMARLKNVNSSEELEIVRKVSSFFFPYCVVNLNFATNEFEASLLEQVTNYNQELGKKVYFSLLLVLRAGEVLFC